MSATTADFPQSGAGRIALRVIHAICAAWTRYIDNRKRMRDLATLSAMDDMSLKDIGISRLDIRAAIRSKRNSTSTRN
jgi:uncharacterized protein YjiS (DUF1127 family)